MKHSRLLGVLAAALALLAMPPSARAQTGAPADGGDPAPTADHGILLMDTELRTEPGFGKPTIAKAKYLEIYRVKNSAPGEGKVLWYGLILREERTPRRVQNRGWVLRLPGETDPLLKDEVPVFRYPSAPEPPKLVKTRWLGRTGTTRHGGAWIEVTWNSRQDRVDELLGYVPSTEMALLPRTTEAEAASKVSTIRANPRWTPQMVAAILRGEVRDGFPREAVILALGEPPVRVELEDHREQLSWRTAPQGPIEIILYRGFVEEIRHPTDRAVIER